MNSPDSAADRFRDFIDHRTFPCVAAKSALATQAMRIVVSGDLRDDPADQSILSALRAAATGPTSAPPLASTVILFPLTPLLTEIAFEKHLWALLQSLHQADRQDFDWDPVVSSDPHSAKFAMSVGGSAFFVVGLHPGSSRLARRAPMAAAAFNPHAQFRLLKAQGLYDRLRKVVRDRDIVLQGEANPMLADHGEASEAAQYSGREVFAGWECPFHSDPSIPT